MKKIFISLVVFMIILFALSFSLLFTKFGNNLIATYIENKVNSTETNLKFKVNNFVLTFENIIFDAMINDNSTINISGDLSIFKKKVDLKYDIKVNDLSIFKELLEQELNGVFSTNGIFKGDEKEALIQGFSNLASSSTIYSLNLVDFKINDLFVEIKDAKIDELFVFFNKPKFAMGNLNINANIKNIDIKNFDGIFNINITKGILNNETINKEFKQTIQSLINFNTNINASFFGNKAEIKSYLNSSLGDIFLEKTLIDFEKNKTTSDYKVEFKNLNKIESLIGKKLNADFFTTGNILHENGLTNFKGYSNIFESITNYDLVIKEWLFNTLSFKIENARLEKLFHFLNEPVYATGDLYFQGDLKAVNNLKENDLTGVIISKINNGKLINEVVNAVYKQNLSEDINFNLLTTSSFFDNKITTKGEILSDITNINFEKAVFDLKDKILKSDYILKIPSLLLMKDFTRVKLRGNIDIVGELENTPSSFLINGNSSILGGEFSFISKNNDLVANFNNINIRDFLYMIHQKEIFDSKANVNIIYNYALKKGDIKGNLFDGHFLANDFSFLFSKLSKVDLTKEIYKNVDILASFDEKELISSFNLQSENTQIDVKDSFINFDNNTMNTNIDIKIAEHNFPIILKGDFFDPNITVETKDLFKNFIYDNNYQFKKK